MAKYILLEVSPEQHRKIKAILAKHGLSLNEFGVALANHIDKTEEIVKAYTKE